MKALATLIVVVLTATYVTAFEVPQSQNPHGLLEGGRIPSCRSSLRPTVIFNTTCHLLSDACWSPRPPGISDVILFPEGTSLTIDEPKLYKPIFATSIIVDKGAHVKMTGGGMTVEKCFIVDGQLSMFPAQSHVAGNSALNYPNDPSVPNGIDCNFQSGGFTPRLCGPGVMYINGRLSIGDYYATLFITTVVSPGGVLSVQDNAFLNNNITNYGTLTAANIYMQGHIHNHGDASLRGINFLVLNMSGWSMNIYNFKSMTFDASTNAASDATVRVINSKGATLIFGGNFGEEALWEGPVFNLYNSGNITWASGDSSQYITNVGFAYNTGIFEANTLTVFLIKFLGAGGQLVTKNGGRFQMGAGGAVRFRSLDSCKRPATPVLEDDSVVKCSSNSPCEYGFCCINGACVKSKCMEECCPGNEVCEQYHDGVYCGGYGAMEKPMSEKRSCDKDLTTTLFDDAAAAAEKKTKLPPTTSQRFGTTHAVQKGIMQIGGDGKSSVSWTRPVEVQASAVLELTEGARVYSLVEFGRPPVVGGGRVVVGRGAKLVLGLHADLSEHGAVEVLAGGELVVPRHGRLAVSNHTIVVRPGGSLHVDGELALHAAATVQHCDDVLGEGTVAKHPMASVEKRC